MTWLLGWLLASSITTLWVPIAAIVISGLTFILSQREFSRKGKEDYTDDLEKRITQCERDRADLRRKVDELTSQNIDLMRRVLNLEKFKS